MLEKLDEIDKKMLLFINGFHNQFFDSLMYYISKTEFWIPLFLLLVYLIIKDFRKRSILIFIILTLAITLSDQIASSVMKPYFKRLRPCHDTSLNTEVHIVKGCGGKYGFVSSHAANTFATATLLTLFFWKRSKKIAWLFLWAIVVSFSRVYLGRHYPGDVVVGGVLGITISILLFYILDYIKSTRIEAETV